MAAPLISDPAFTFLNGTERARGAPEALWTKSADMRARDPFVWREERDHDPDREFDLPPDFFVDDDVGELE